MKTTSYRTYRVWGGQQSLLAILALILILATLLAACNGVGSKSTPVVAPPTVTIASPANGHTVPAGMDVSINSTANDAQGVLKVELWVDGSLYRVDASPDPAGQTTFVVSQPWHADVPGSHTVVVKAYSKSGQMAESALLVINVQASAATLPTDTPPPPATDTPVSPPPTNTPVPSAPTDTPALPPSPQPIDTFVPPTDTSLPPTPTATPTMPPPAEPTNTSTPPPSVPAPFAQVWNAIGGAGGRLGNPVAEAVLARWLADQFFEGGLAFWRNNELVPADYIYVLLYKGGSDQTQGDTWLQFEDLWREGMLEFSCPEAQANGDLGPKRGFGKVWCEETAVHDGLKQPLVVEQGADGGFQDFEGGAMLWLTRLGYVYVLYDDGDWQRFSDH